MLVFPFFCLQVGTGFSFTNDSRGFSTDETEVAVNLYSALTQFFMVFSEYQANDFYLTGEVHVYNDMYLYTCIYACIAHTCKYHNLFEWPQLLLQLSNFLIFQKPRKSSI